MKIRLADHLVQKLSEIGQAIDIDQPTFVFDGGEVGIVKNLDDKEEQNEREGTRGSAAGSRQGATGSRRSPCEAGNPVGSIWPEWLIDDNVTLLLGSYPGSRVTNDANGAWLGVPINPLGTTGPRALLVIAIPKSRGIHPRCWAFWVESIGLRWVGPRHTNYPYGDACAFPQFKGHWARSDGIRLYVDIHAEWLIRQLHHLVFRRWVGRQMAPFALYALNQFTSVEQCHCANGRPYGGCCQVKDFGEYRADPTRQLRLAFDFTQCRWFNGQSPPPEILKFAMGGTAPDLARTFRLFREVVELAGRADLFKKQLLQSSSPQGLTAAPSPIRLAA